jgi:hypothetical protein
MSIILITISAVYLYICLSVRVSVRVSVRLYVRLYVGRGAKAHRNTGNEDRQESRRSSQTRLREIASPDQETRNCFLFYSE